MRFERVDIKEIKVLRRTPKENEDFVRQFVESGEQAVEVFWQKDYKTALSASGIYRNVIKRMKLENTVRVYTKKGRMFFVRNI